MPYIAQKQRKELDAGCIPANAGELNYALHLLLEKYMSTKTESYQNYNDIIGVLSAVGQEIYRRKISPFEDLKKNQNGDIEFYS